MGARWRLVERPRWELVGGSLEARWRLVGGSWGACWGLLGARWEGSSLGARWGLVGAGLVGGACCGLDKSFEASDMIVLGQSAPL